MSSRILAIAVAGVVAAVPAQAQEWVGVYNPTQVLTLNLTVSAQDWDTIRHDLTNEIEVPAQFWADGGPEPPLLVSVRRKSSRALPSESNPQKVSIKIDVNEFVDGQTWRGLTKLSLENGADTDPISEGFAWNLHELATGPGLYPSGYHAGLAAWVRLVVNDELIGLYVTVEERDSQFLRNRLLPRGGTPSRSWLYEIDDIGAGLFELEDGNLSHGPTWTELCYAPFSGGKGAGGCATPNDAFLATRLPQLIDMPIMLTQGAVDAFSSNRDALFTHGKNFRHIDFNPAYAVNEGRKRLYLMWDLDAAITNTDANIYATKSGRRFTQTPYQQVILNHPMFRDQYNTIMRALLDPATGPLSETALHAFLTSVEPHVAFALAEDPYAGFTPASVAAHFDALRNWVTDRIAIVLNQVSENVPAPRP